MTQGKRYGPKGYIPKFERGISRGVAQTKKSVPAPKSKPKIPETPKSKPFTNPIKTSINKIPEKLKKVGKFLTTSQDKTKNMKKAEIPDKFKQKIAMRKIKNVAKDVFNKKNGGRTMKDFSGDGKITQKDVLMGRGVIPKPKKNGGITEGIRKIKGMKHGGQCRGMGAAKRGGKFHEA